MGSFVGALSAHSEAFLLVVALATTVLFGAPMAIAPLRWARMLGWSFEAPAHLAIYFGRCLGVVVIVLGVVVLSAAGDPALRPVLFRILLGCFAGMLAVHAWGAVRRIQPRAETIEIGAWALMLVLGVLFLPR